MEDKLLTDIDKINDIEGLKAIIKDLIAEVKKCRETIEQQKAIIAAKDAEIATLKKMVFGQKSERMKPVAREVAAKHKDTPGKAAAKKAEADKKRQDNAAAKKKLPTEEIIYDVKPEDCLCPQCGGTTYSDLGFEESFEYEYIPPTFKQIWHRRRKKVCSCKGHIVAAPPPPRVQEGVIYGPGLHAHVAVSKCKDSIPFYRLEGQYERAGIQLHRSSICDMFHRSARLLKPLHERTMEIISESEYVNADETPIPVQEKEKTRKAYMWVFIGGGLVGYAFAASRSGDTPMRILGDTTGVLQVDQYSGYNQVTKPGKRQRAGCLAHARRKFHEALDTAPELANRALEDILKIYEVEYEAAEQGILGSDKHLAMRDYESRTIMEGLKKYCEDEAPKHLPKGPAAKAIGYFLGNYDDLALFLKDQNIKLDNNISEGQLRLIALGRKNYLFVGNDVAGENLAVLQTLVASCTANGINPQTYLSDVLIRIQTHPASAIDNLLPHKWKPPQFSGEDPVAGMGDEESG